MRVGSHGSSLTWCSAKTEVDLEPVATVVVDAYVAASNTY